MPSSLIALIGVVVGAIISGCFTFFTPYITEIKKRKYQKQDHVNDVRERLYLDLARENFLLGNEPVSQEKLMRYKEFIQLRYGEIEIFASKKVKDALYEFDNYLLLNNLTPPKTFSYIGAKLEIAQKMQREIVGDERV